MCYQQLTLPLQKNLELFKADGTSDIWKAYVDYVDEMVVDGFFNTIHCSLKFLLDNTDPKNNPDDLFKVNNVFYYCYKTDWIKSY